MITETIKLSLKQNSKQVTICWQTLINVAGKGAVWRYSLQHNAIANNAVEKSDMNHMQSGRID
jgi:hypothetical protein